MGSSRGAPLAMTEHLLGTSNISRWEGDLDSLLPTGVSQQMGSGGRVRKSKKPQRTGSLSSRQQRLTTEKRPTHTEPLREVLRKWPLQDHCCPSLQFSQCHPLPGSLRRRGSSQRCPMQLQNHVFQAAKNRPALDVVPGRQAVKGKHEES